MCNTYGTWVRGDRRGWRERHHRGHVEGDYKHPPKKGTFEKVGARSRDLMNRDPVRLEREVCEVALRSFVDCLVEHGSVVLIACLDASHLHILMQCRDKRPRQRLGWAKLAATRAVKKFLNAHGTAMGLSLDLKTGEGIWGKRSQCAPIRDAGHRLNTLKYIAGHGSKGAMVWLDPRVPKRVESIS